MTDVTIVALPMLAFAVTAGLIPVVGWLARRWGVTAEALANGGNGSRVPLLGGVAIVAGFLFALAAARELTVWSVAGAVVLLAVGVADDVWVLQPYQKLACQVAVSAGVIWLTGAPRFSPWPMLDAAMAIFWLVATTNAFNLIDGIDGLAGGVAIAAALSIGAAAYLHQAPALAVMALALAGAAGGFLIYNFHPATVFMGDSGALPTGFLLGMLAMRTGELAIQSKLAWYAFPFLVMAMPLLDTAIVSVTRLATGRPISRRGLDHSHHRLLALGLTIEATAVLCWMVTAVTGGCAVALSLLPHSYVLTALPLVAAAVAIIGLFMMDLTFEANAPGDVYRRLGGFARLILSLGYRRRLAEAALDAAWLTSAYLGAYLLRRNFEISGREVSLLLPSIPWVLAAGYAAFSCTGVYRGIWRYTELVDIVRFANGAVLAGLILVALSVAGRVSASPSIVILFVMLLFNFLAVSRLSFRLLRTALGRLGKTTQRVLIVGAGSTAAIAAQRLGESAGGGRLVGFVDDDGFKLGKLVLGRPVLGAVGDLERVYAAIPFDRILVCEEALGEGHLRLISEVADRYNLDVRRLLLKFDEVTAGLEGPGAALPNGKGLNGRSQSIG